MEKGAYALLETDSDAPVAQVSTSRTRRSRVLVGLGCLLFGVACVVLSIDLNDHAVVQQMYMNLPDPEELWVGEKQVALTPLPKSLENGGDLVVYWSKEPWITPKDYLTLTCGPTNGEDDYLQRKNVTEIDASWHSVRFQDLYMMRCDYIVHFFSYNVQKQSFEQIETIRVPMRESINSPKHGHLALTTDWNSMAIMFNSASSKTPEAQYGLTPDRLHKHATGSSTTYKASDMCHAPANVTAQTLFRDPGYMHTVLLNDLEPGRVYFYRYGNDQDGWSSVRSFKSRPSKHVKHTKFIAYADMGVDAAPASKSTAMKVYEDVMDNGYDDFLLHFGDISYARGEGSVWDKFFAQIEPYATRVPYMIQEMVIDEYDYVAGGERDPSNGSDPSGHSFHPPWGNYGSDSLGECSVPMYHRWHVPATGRSLYWYSFDYGGVHVIQLSSEHDWTRTSDQYQWLQQDLRRVDRSHTPWVVVTTHRMMYTTQDEPSQRDQVVSRHMRAELEDLLYEHRVNLVLVGHQHSYERSCPVYKTECMDDGRAPVHIVVGSAGYHLETYPFSSEIGNWSVSHVAEYGYLRVATTPDAMNLQFVLNKDGTVFDESTIMPWK